MRSLLTVSCGSFESRRGSAAVAEEMKLGSSGISEISILLLSGNVSVYIVMLSVLHESGLMTDDITLTYTSHHPPADRCCSCLCTLPTNVAGYCQRCYDGWVGFIDLQSASVELLNRELSLVEYARTTEESRGKIGSKKDLDLMNLADSIRKELRTR
jgi:hypothetical protein